LARAFADRSGAVFVLAAVGAFALLLAIAHRFSFWQDEWSFIGRADLLDPSSWLEPHNEHWSTLPSIAYGLTLGLVGLSSYLPYLVQVLGLHLLVAAGVFVLVRRRSGPLPGLAAGILILLLGSGYQNLFWAFQTGFVGSVAAGVWALVAFERPGVRHAAVGSFLLLVGLACSNIGLVFLVAATVELLLRGGRRWLAVIPPAAAYGAWYLTFGRAAVALQNPFSVDAFADVAYYLVAGTSTAVGGVTGTTSIIGGVVAATGLVALAWLLVRDRRLEPRVAGSLAGVAFLYASVGLARGTFGSDFTNRSRYVYVAAVLLTLLAAASLNIAFRGRQWPTPARLALAGVVVLAIAGNVAALFRGAEVFRVQTDLTRAYVDLVQQNEAAPWIDPAVRPPGLPEPKELLELTRRLGSPTVDAILPGAAPPPGPAERERALLMLVGDGFHVRPGAPPAGRAGPPTILRAHGVASTPGECLAVKRIADLGTLEILAPSDAWIEVELPDGGSGAAMIGHEMAPSFRSRQSFQADAGRRVSIHVPTIDDRSDWRVGIEVSAPSARICTWTARPLT